MWLLILKVWGGWLWVVPAASELPAHQDTGRHSKVLCLAAEREEACFLWKVLDKSDFPLVK